jgi:predicted nucleotidyltransferase
MKNQSLIDLEILTSQLSEKIPYLKMLVLFGSRATGKTHAKSDWDFATLYDEEKRKICIGDSAFSWFEVPQKLADVFQINSNEIDVVELNRCSSLIANFVARDGKLLYESEPGEFEKFKQTALMSESEIQEIEGALVKKIENFLKEWSLA